ncbi:hypothetical protein N7491_000295 [Penicillium cf. griseofulvum]|uniref:Uncharacterized protein n=1 Tax=Penicillium cf. griseofulvum TaxID=2972120 RepID=A0A9W9JML4_9EURO|nr:hypothetical protein N7472_004348 [Penicillium cf. griseofulvum]KAJ5441907.1 hypothetical protein N7445_004914 [Penicillium cf. griseofulvum]KAJ5451113.1 hypothetical protein N7491_000295 [Penicillium cf. griseofulvum]
MPGFWAKRAIECEWKRGLTASLTRGSLLYRLIRMPLQREPVIQLNRAIQIAVNPSYEAYEAWTLPDERRLGRDWEGTGKKLEKESGEI